jgi:hypothetical protein
MHDLEKQQGITRAELESLGDRARAASELPLPDKWGTAYKDLAADCGVLAGWFSRYGVGDPPPPFTVNITFGSPSLDSDQGHPTNLSELFTEIPAPEVVDSDQGQ